MSNLALLSKSSGDRLRKPLVWPACLVGRFLDPANCLHSRGEALLSPFVEPETDSYAVGQGECDRENTRL